MDRVRFLEHEGRKVLLIDYSHLEVESDILEVVRRRRELVAQQPPESLLTLTDATGAKLTHASLSEIKQAAVFDRPKLRRAALVGPTNQTCGPLPKRSPIFPRDNGRFSARARLRSSGSPQKTRGTRKGRARSKSHTAPPQCAESRGV